MPLAVPESVRSAVWLLHQQGQPAEAIALALSLGARTVYRLLARFRCADGPCAAAYHRCGRARSAAAEVLCQQALGLRRLHPGWGAGRILAELAKRHPPPLLPDRSTLKRWLARGGLAPQPRRPARPFAPRAGRPHRTWQMDACEMIPLASGTRACWLRLVDEASGAFLFTRVFAHEHWTAVGKLAVQALLRDAFSRWGLPGGIRVDHGLPWVIPGGLPSDLELWLAGLAVPLHLIRVRRPEDNGKVERSNGTAKRWSEPQQCHSAAQLQLRVDEEDRVQRELYRDEHGLTRRERYPDLLSSGRGYAPGWEKACWELELALNCLGGCPVRRKVNKQGQISLYDHHHRVGQQYAEQVAEVRFDVASLQWRFLVGEQQAGRSTATHISQERIVGLQLGSRQGRSKRQTAAKRASGQANTGQ
jgi:transposase InsO family protein